MKLSDQLKKDRQQLSKFTTLSQKLTFIWDYYKALVIAVAFILIVSLISFVSNIGRENINLYVVLLNNDTLVAEYEESFFNDTMSRRGIDMKGKTSSVNTELSLGLSNNEAADMETMQVLTALFSISDLEVYVAPEEYFESFAANNGFAALSLLIDSSLLEKEDLYRYDNGQENRPVQGIILHSDSPLHKAGYYHDDVIIGVVGNAANFDEAIAFLQQMLRDRN